MREHDIPEPPEDGDELVAWARRHQVSDRLEVHEGLALMSGSPSIPDTVPDEMVRQVGGLTRAS